ncbi:MAG: tetratricopeptide repeat protein [Planctomycetes bacterium]|nr:tetratricopeptide repeat protein [Planctomycetota bacterium]
MEKELHITNRRLLILAGLIAAVLCCVLITYWPVLSAEAISFDDERYLVINPLVQNPSWSSTKHFFTEVFEPSTVPGYYQPLAMVSLMLDYAMGGRPDNLMPFHITSLCLHLINTSLVIVFLYMLFGKIWTAVIAGLLFGLHPLTVEPIPWVAERKTLLATFFALWCLIIYIRYSYKRNLLLYLGCVATFVLSLMSKPTTTLLPFLLLLLDFWPLRRLNKRTLIEKVPLFIVMITSAVVTIISQGRTEYVTMPTKCSFVQNLLVFCHNIVFYLYKVIQPIKLSSYYPFPKPFVLLNPEVLTGVVGTCVLLAVLLISLRWTRALITGGLFFFVAVFPTMGVIGFTKVIARDNYIYFPFLGLLMILVWFLERLWSRISDSLIRKIIFVAFILIVAGSESIATRRYLANWKTTETLYQHMLSLSPTAATLNYNYGCALLKDNKLDEAVNHFRRALLGNPRHVGAHNNLATTLQSQNELDEALKHFRLAAQLNPYDAEIQNNLGIVLRLQDKFDEAIRYFRQALQFEPDYADAHYNLGVVFELRGEFEEAAKHLTETLRIKPDYPNARTKLVIALVRHGNALIRQHRFDEAIPHLNRVLQMEPNLVDVMNNLAWVLSAYKDSQFHNPERAVQISQRACELTGYKEPTLLDTLAVAYAAIGDFPNAITTAEKAANFAEAADKKQLAQEIKSRIKLYKNNQPYIEPSRD